MKKKSPPHPRRSNPSHLSDHAEMNCGGVLSGLRTQIASFQVYMIGVIKMCKGWIVMGSSSPLLSKAGGGRQDFYGQHGQFPVTWQTCVCRHVRHMQWIIMWCKKTWRNEGLREEENFRRKTLIATTENPDCNPRTFETDKRYSNRYFIYHNSAFPIMQLGSIIHHNPSAQVLT